MQAHLDGTVRVFTFKEGLLSRIAHDLRLDVGRFDVRLDGERVKASFETTSLTVDGVMKKGRLDRNGLNKRDMSQIQRTIRDEIFHSNRFPQISFEGVREGSRISGTLEMKGRRADLAFDIGSNPAQWTGRVELRPSRWGIPPYKALMGAIKLKDKIVVTLELAVQAIDGDGADS